MLGWDGVWKSPLVSQLVINIACVVIAEAYSVGTVPGPH